MSEITFIYALEDPRFSNCIRYIGKTDNPNDRLYAHLIEKPNHDKRNKHKINWIKNLAKENLKPIITIVDEVIVSEWKFWEKHYISLYKSWGFELLNKTTGGDGTDGYKHNLIAKEKIRVKAVEMWQNEEIRNQIIEKNTNQKRDIQQRKNLSNGISNSKKWRDAVTSDEFRSNASIRQKGKEPGNKGKNAFLETRKLQSIARTGKKDSEQTKLNKSIAQRNIPKKECKHCHRSFDPRNYSLFHGDNCKLNPNRTQESIDRRALHSLNISKGSKGKSKKKRNNG